jgi:biopolymer transport protein ExbD
MARTLRADEPGEIVLPTASFLDMVFQLFAFFIITYNPASLEGEMAMALPASSQARAEKPEDVDPTALPDPDAELKTEVVVTVKTAGDGTLGTVSVEDEVGVAKEVKVDFSKDADLSGLRDYLKQMQKGLTTKDAIKIKADPTMKMAFVARVMDACAKAGYSNIGFAPPPDYKASN